MPRKLREMGLAERTETPEQHERRLAEAVGGKRQPASGSLPFAKGDVKSSKFLYDAKLTKHASYKLSLEVLDKLSQEAMLEGRHPALQVRFGSSGAMCSSDWVVMPLDVFVEHFEQEE